LEHVLHGVFVDGVVGLGGDVEAIGLEPVGTGDLTILYVVGELEAGGDGNVLHAKGVAHELRIAIVLELNGLLGGTDGCDGEGRLLRLSRCREEGKSRQSQKCEGDGEGSADAGREGKLHGNEYEDGTGEVPGFEGDAMISGRSVRCFAGY